MDRRQLLLRSAALGSVLAPFAGHADDDRKARRSRTPSSPTSPSTTPALAAPTSPKARVVVVGGGMGGASVAKYLRLWGDQIDVTLVDRSSSYTSNIMSSLVLSGQRTLSSLNYGYTSLRDKYGVRLAFGEVKAVNPGSVTYVDAGNVTRTLLADRIVVAPGIEFAATPGLLDPNKMPHAWKAGPQTTLLRQQLLAMRAGGTVILTIPPKPYRCPPGPYERACLLADWLRVYKPGSKLIVLDANVGGPIAEPENFLRAFAMLGVEYHSGVPVVRADSSTMQVTVVDATGTESTLSGDVVNLIPRQMAPKIAVDAGLAAPGGFAPVNVLSYESTARPGIHVIGDASATTQPKAGHIANQEGKVCADAISRLVAGGSPDPAPVTNSACFSTITMTEASWLSNVFQYDAATASMKSAVAAADQASLGWSADNFSQMNKWFGALMADTFA